MGRKSTLPRMERILLENLLDSLDWLYDSQMSPLQLHAFMLATGVALKDTPHFEMIDSTTRSLELLRGAGLTYIEKRDRALGLTDDLRLYLARLFPFE